MKAKLLSEKAALVPGPQGTCGCGMTPCSDSGIQTACNPCGHSPGSY